MIGGGKDSGKCGCRLLHVYWNLNIRDTVFCYVPNDVPPTWDWHLTQVEVPSHLGGIGVSPGWDFIYISMITRFLEFLYMKSIYSIG